MKYVLIMFLIGVIVVFGFGDTAQVQTTTYSVYGNITYPPGIDTDEEKLASVYILVHLMRTEHNRQGGIASASFSTDPGMVGKWDTYREIYHSKITSLLQEQSRLRDKIRKKYYSDSEWSELQMDLANLTDIQNAMWGDKLVIQELVTVASTSYVDELGAINLSTLTGEWVDPYEDFTLFTEVDPPDKITVTSTQLTISGFNRTDECYITYDYGVNHFSGDYEHLYDIQIDDQDDDGGGGYAWSLTNNDTDTVRDLIVGDQDAHVLIPYNSPSGYNQFYLRESNDGEIVSDNTGTDEIWTVWYYITFRRDEGVGANGTLYGYIYTDPERTTQTASSPLTVTLTENQDFRYGYGCSSANSGTPGEDISFKVANLDLQEQEAGRVINVSIDGRIIVIQ